MSITGMQNTIIILKIRIANIRTRIIKNYVISLTRKNVVN